MLELKTLLIFRGITAFLLFPASVSAETPGDANGDGYYGGDVAVINSLIENNGMPLTPDAPAERPDRKGRL